MERSSAAVYVNASGGSATQVWLIEAPLDSLPYPPSSPLVSGTLGPACTLPPRPCPPGKKKTCQNMKLIYLERIFHYNVKHFLLSLPQDGLGNPNLFGGPVPQTGSLPERNNM